MSTSEQTTDQQREALEAAGIMRIYEDVASGARVSRPGLQARLDYARERDTVTVATLDRLGYSTSHVLQTIDELHQRRIVLKSLRQRVDFSTPVGQMVAAIMSAGGKFARFDGQVVHACPGAGAHHDCAKEVTNGRVDRSDLPVAFEGLAVRSEDRLVGGAVIGKRDGVACFV